MDSIPIPPLLPWMKESPILKEMNERDALADAMAEILNAKPSKPPKPIVRTIETDGLFYAYTEDGLTAIYGQEFARMLDKMA